MKAFDDGVLSASHGAAVDSRGFSGCTRAWPPEQAGAKKQEEKASHLVLGGHL